MKPSTYWNMDEQARDRCLNCPLSECVHMPDAVIGDVCAVDGYQVLSPEMSPWVVRRNKTLAEIIRLISKIDFLSITEAAKILELRRSTLDTWAAKGYISVARQKSPNGNGRRWVITGVNEVGDA